MRNPNLRPSLEFIRDQIAEEATKAIQHNHEDCYNPINCSIDSFTLEYLYISLGEAITLLEKIESDKSFDRALTALEYGQRSLTNG